MEDSESAGLCEVCSKLDLKCITRPPQPCDQPLPCWNYLDDDDGSDVLLGSIAEIKSRRSHCAICRLVSDGIDKESPELLDGECWMKEGTELCNFQLPEGKTQAPTATTGTHFHIARASVILITSETQDIQDAHNIICFQAKAKFGAGDATSSEQEHDLVDMIGGRYVGAQVDMELIRAWLHHCENGHGKDCKLSLRHPLQSQRSPTFLIDVIDSCLVDAPSECRYIALSYVWGTGAVFKHLHENSTSLRSPGVLSSLPIPTTIRDAMTVVHAIRERYLWVDSICIIQNDLQMQQTEITRMGSIYSNALFTIIGASGDNANSGLPGVRPGTREQLQRVVKLASGEAALMTHYGEGEHGHFRNGSFLPRALIFTDTQVYWSCRRVLHSEELALEVALHVQRDLLSSIHPGFPISPSFEPMEPREYRKLYTALLFSYRQRRLTFQTDLLNAFAGISEVLAMAQDDRCIWGLPESQFSYAMTWHFMGRCSRNDIHASICGSDGTMEAVPVPSWSWSAWSCDSLRFNLIPGEVGVQPVTEFYIVDSRHQLVKITEQLWQDFHGEDLHGVWQEKKDHQLQLPTQDVLSRIGHLYFWTSCANLKAFAPREMIGDTYKYFPPDDPMFEQLSTSGDRKIVSQDFIVVAAQLDPELISRLIMLAVEWKDGIAYRLGTTEIREKDWIQVENREWKLVILG
ncbi:heterokaryon incompatibility protein-domain-containing protein [Lanmaoa asiatica]|nr:heterokaryon incompatibility protein-domain-containing protein [Lanmaoa asiatica]